MYNDNLVHTLVQVYHLKDLVSYAYLLISKLVLLKFRVHFQKIGNLFVLFNDVSKDLQLVIKKYLKSLLVLVTIFTGGFDIIIGISEGFIQYVFKGQ